jgi:hypothetical protein
LHKLSLCIRSYYIFGLIAGISGGSIAGILRGAQLSLSGVGAGKTSFFAAANAYIINT